jgi:hypothetical protein
MWRRRLAELTLLTAEAVVLFMLAAALAAVAGGHGPAFVTVWAAVLGGFFLVRLLLRFDVATPPLVLAGAVTTALALLALGNLQYNPSGGPLALTWLFEFAAHPDAFLQDRWPAVWGVVALCAGWLRGVWAAQRDLTYERALRSISAGLSVVVVLVLFWQGSRAAGAINAAALPVFMLGLLSLALVHLAQAEYQTGDFLRGPWLLTLGGTVAALTVLSIAAGLFPLEMLNQLLAPLGLLALRVLDVLIFLIAYPIALLIVWLIGLVTGGRPLEWPQPRNLATTTAEQVQRQSEHTLLLAALLFLLKVLFVLALAALVGFVLWQIFRHLRRPGRGMGVEETREALHEGGLSADLAALVEALAGRFRRQARAVEPDLPPAVLAIRRLYLRALQRAEERGAVRPPAATPHEFAPELARALDTAAAVDLSECFAAARYGLLPPPPATLAELERGLAEGHGEAGRRPLTRT